MTGWDLRCHVIPGRMWARQSAFQFTALQAPCADFEHDSYHLDITQSHRLSIFIWASRGKNLPTTDSRLWPGEDGVGAGKSLWNVGIRRARSQLKRRSLPDTGSLSHLDLAISFRAQRTNHASDVHPSQLFRLPCHQIMPCACSASAHRVDLRVQLPDATQQRHSSTLPVNK